MSCLLADVGGTNTRCAIVESGGEIRDIRTFLNCEFSEPGALLECYLQGIDIDVSPRRGMLAIAAPIRGDMVDMINIDWHFSATSLRDRLGFEKLGVLNDFEALANALPEFGQADLLKIGSGEVESRKPKVVLGAGTGLGVAGLIPVGDGWQSVSGEGGHVSLPATDQREAEIIHRVQQQFGHCSAERLISGPGLALLHSLMHETDALTADEIGRLAAAGDPHANASLELLFRLLGTVAANLALTFGAFGGLYIGGGIIPRHAEKFAASGFRDRFEAKGRYGDYLGSIATYLVIAEHPTLTGLAVYARESAY